jgi:hypothetical protein
MLPLTVGVASALVVFSVLVFAFGDVGTSSPATASGASSSSSSGGTVATVSTGPAEPSAPRVVTRSVGGQGEIVTQPVPLKIGDELRLKVVPEAAFDAQVGITMPKDQVVADYFQKGFKGDVQRLFPIQNGLLYSDTLTPSTSVALEANDLGKEGAAEWLVFVAPTSADYAIVVRGRDRSVGSYSMTLQTRDGSAKAAVAKRLAADDRWLDHDATGALAREDMAFLGELSFYDDAEFRTDGDDTRPTPASIETLIATGS